MGVTSTETVTRTELVDDALAEVGNSNPNNTQRAQAVRFLNKLLKQLDPMAQWSWTSSFVPGSINTVANQRAYTTSDGLASNIFELVHVDKVTGTTLSPITIIDTATRLSSVDREGTGEPQWAYLQRAPTLSAQKLEFLPTPDGVYTYQYTYRRRLYDFTASSDNPDFPGEWNHALSIMLADKLARIYGMDLQDRQELKIEALDQMRQMIAANGGGAYVPTLSVPYY